MAVSIGALMSSATRVQTSDEQVRLWRRTFNVDDPRADVGRKLGDGTVRQGKIVIATIIEAAKKWFDTENKEARAAYAEIQRANAERNDQPTVAKKERVLRWNLLNTLDALLNFTDFKSGECIATYEMIADAAGICRDTVYKHLNRLRELRLIDWVRRCEPTGNKEGQRTKAAPNAYFFEISRLPTRVQILIRQMLNRRGVKLEAHPDRRGSGSVPNRAQRLATHLGKSLSQAKDLLAGRKRQATQLAAAEFINAETALMGDIPTAKWAAIRHPNDLAAQQAYNARLGIYSTPHESLNLSLQSAPEEQGNKD